jgi:hypothetical protein
MKLVQARVTKFRNILDSGDVEIEKDITCLVGKNESGKTAFLHPIYLLNPARSNLGFSVHYQYPAWLEKKDRLKHIDLEKVRPVKAKFELEASDVESIEAKLGKGILKSTGVSIERDYSGTYFWNPPIHFDEKAFLQFILSSLALPPNIADISPRLSTTAELTEFISSLQKKTDDPEAVNAARMIDTRVKEILGTKSFTAFAEAIALKLIPQFFYFHEFSTLPYSVDINRILQSSDKDLDDGELTARSLLRLAAADGEYLMNPDYERRKRELENVANALTQDVLKYWRQNPDLRVLPDITQKPFRIIEGYIVSSTN